MLLLQYIVFQCREDVEVTNIWIKKNVLMVLHRCNNTNFISVQFT